MRKTFTDLKMSLILKALEVLPRELYKYHASDHVLTWLPTNSRIQFGHAERPEDITRYLGAEFDHIGVDELTQHTEQTIKFLWSRLRTSKQGVVTKFFAATNPGGVGHRFVKRLWLDKNLTKEELDAGFTGADFEFIPARVDDNEYMDKAYVANLMMLPENQRKMYLEGSWEIYEGKFFEEFDEAVHVIESFPVPESWYKFRAIDFGRTAPFCCLWLALDQDGVVYVYKEHYQRGWEVDQNADAILRLSKDEDYKYTVIDSAVFSKTGFGETIGQRLQRKGLSIIPAHKNRIAGWSALKQYLHGEKDRTGKTTGQRLKVMKSCPALIEELNNALYSKHSQEDLNSDLDDHALDALRYFIMTLRDSGTKLSPLDSMHGVNPLIKQMFKERSSSKFENMYNPYAE